MGCDWTEDPGINTADAAKKDRGFTPLMAGVMILTISLFAVASGIWTANRQLTAITARTITPSVSGLPKGNHFVFVLDCKSNVHEDVKALVEKKIRERNPNCKITLIWKYASNGKE